MVDVKKIEIPVGDKVVTIETGKYAKSASGSVVVRCGDTMLLVHAVVSPEPRVGIDFFPLLIDYEERMSAVGRIPGGYNRSEGKASDKAILFQDYRQTNQTFVPKGYRNDVQIVSQLVSLDHECQPDTLAMLGSSAALMLTEAPFEGPIGAVRVGRIDGQFVANPSYADAAKSDIDIVVAGTHDSVIMVEAGAKFVTEEDIMNAVEFAQKEIARQCELQEQFARECGINKPEFVNPYDTTAIAKIINDIAYDKVTEAYHDFDREGRKAKLDEAKKMVKAEFDSYGDDHEAKIMMAETGIELCCRRIQSS